MKPLKSAPIRHFKIAWICGSLAAIALSFQNCTPGFEAVGTSLYSKSQLQPGDDVSDRDVDPGVNPSGAALDISIDALGGDPTGVRDNTDIMRNAINQATGKPGARILFGAGTYRFDCANRPSPTEGAQGNYCFFVQGFTNLKIFGHGGATTLKYSDPTVGAFYAVNSVDVTFGHLKIDYSTLPFTQGTVSEVNASEGSFVYEIAAGYNELNQAPFDNPNVDQWGILMDPVLPRPKRNSSTSYRFSQIAKIEGTRKWKMTLDSAYKPSIYFFANGDSFAYIIRGPTTIYYLQNQDSGVQNLVLNSGPGLATEWTRNHGVITIDGLEIRAPAGSGRKITTTGDGIHAQENRARFVIQNSYFEGMGDDAINIYSASRKVRGANGLTIDVDAAEFIIGDILQIYSSDTSLKGRFRVIAIAADAQQLALEPILQRQALGAGDTFFIEQTSAPNTVVKNNIFAGFRGMGLRLRSENSQLIGNQFTDLNDFGLLIAQDLNEGPFPNMVTVSGNVFSGIDMVDSSLYLNGINTSRAQIFVSGPGIGHVNIHDNTFFKMSTETAFISGLEILDFNGNLVDPLGTARINTGPVSLIQYVGNVNSAGNTILDSRPTTTTP